MYQLFSFLFAALPIASVLQKTTFIVHAGLFQKDHITLAQLQAYRRLFRSPPKNSILEDMLWSDPMMNRKGRTPSPRGAGIKFGSDVCEMFLKENNLLRMIRSHECVHNGFESFYDGKLMTIFSASNYCGTYGNKASVIEFFGTDKWNVFTYSTVDTLGKKLSRYVKRKHAKKLEMEVINKIRIRVCTRRKELAAHFSPLRGSNINRLTWNKGMKKVLELDLPFIHFQNELIGHSGTKIDYSKWLDGFEPNNKFIATNHLNSEVNSLGN